MSSKSFAAVVAALAAALAAAPVAGAQQYPPPSKPQGSTGKPKGPFKTLYVCKKKSQFPGKRCFPRITDAVKRASAGDTIRVAPGTYKESVSITGSKKRYINLIGDPKRPERVVLDGENKRANGVLINSADEVTVNGFTATRYRANGFFVTNAKGYSFTNLRAVRAGVYGLYAFNSIGGKMTKSVAYYHSDAGFYVGQTPPQAKPVRTLIKNVEAYGNVLGYSGTNSRYVTITDSKFYNNGSGIVPNALDSEKYPPAENNVITRNEVFWNNFNYYLGAPFRRGSTTAGGVPYPIGVGILLYGGRGNQVTNNKVYGNYLVGIGAMQAITLQQADAKDLVGNRIAGNEFGLGGQDPNGRDLFYDGNGSDNCFENNGPSPKLFPEDGSTFRPCSQKGPNVFNAGAQATAIGWALAEDHEAAWIRGPHVSKPGVKPLERWSSR